MEEADQESSRSTTLLLVMGLVILLILIGVVALIVNGNPKGAPKGILGNWAMKDNRDVKLNISADTITFTKTILLKFKYTVVAPESGKVMLEVTPPLNAPAFNVEVFIQGNQLRIDKDFGGVGISGLWVRE